MKMYEALAMLCAAKKGSIPLKEDAVEKYGEISKQALLQIGFKQNDLDNEYPENRLQVDLYLICSLPAVFAKEARAAEKWFISRN